MDATIRAPAVRIVAAVSPAGRRAGHVLRHVGRRWVRAAGCATQSSRRARAARRWRWRSPQPASASQSSTTSGRRRSSPSASGWPPACRRSLLCTSGTAATHFHAAVVEAGLSDVPHARAHRRPAARAARCRRGADDRSDHAVRRRGAVVPRSGRRRRRDIVDLGGDGRSGVAAAAAGPIPVRCTSTCRSVSRWSGRVDRGARRNRPCGRRPGASRRLPADVESIASTVSGRRGVIVAGRGVGDGAAVDALADHPGWPVLAEPRSGCRHLASAVGAFDSIVARRGRSPTPIRPMSCCVSASHRRRRCSASGSRRRPPSSCRSTAALAGSTRTTSCIDTSPRRSTSCAAPSPNAARRRRTAGSTDWTRRRAARPSGDRRGARADTLTEPGVARVLTSGAPAATSSSRRRCRCATSSGTADPRTG